MNRRSYDKKDSEPEHSFWTDNLNLEAAGAIPRQRETLVADTEGAEGAE